MEKRRDHKGRVLRNGESQRSDGRYCYTYYVDGKRQFLYSWKLERNDKLPEGKRDCVALRDQETTLTVRRAKGDALVATCTVYELVEDYLKLRTDVRITTKKGYKTVLNILRNDPFGSRKINTIKVSDAKRWLIGLQQGGKGFSSIHNIRGVLRPAFRMAYEDEILTRNPFDFELSTILVNDSAKREAVSNKDEKRFLEFIKSDDHFHIYYEGIYILFKTGLRISEFCGLTIDDIDFENMTINVDHQLQQAPGGKHIIVPTKTNAGTRVIPMKEDVAECFRKIISNRLNKPRREPVIDGKTGFLYFNKEGKPFVEWKWGKVFEGIIEKHNKTYKDELPKITPHICRHTYCTNMAKAGIVPKSLQYLMGHSEIAITMNVYTHVGLEDAQNELKRLEAMNEKTVFCCCSKFGNFYYHFTTISLKTVTK